jgi:hypothetical protein
VRGRKEKEEKEEFLLSLEVKKTEGKRQLMIK